FEDLRTWRREIAAEQKVPAFCIVTDATLVAIAESLPVGRSELARVPGIGQAKLDRFGDDILDILNKIEKKSKK
ncbi:MAG TPA: HRDC domain-containing protein, partial [Nocardioidaceae bacterium]|nr:HRDC domain-containing protein [Nocardioidaceae bacterium]